MERGLPSVPWILSYSSPDLPGPLADAIRRGEVAGLLLFRDNLGGSWKDARERCAAIRSLVPPGRPFLLAIDEEGGLISQTSRLALPGGGRWPAVPTPRALGRIDDERAARFVGRLLGRRLRALGFSVNFAPCLDLDTEGESPVIGSRSFGADPARVAALGEAFARGLGDAGVTACFKHYPGHGGTRRDSHRELPRMEPAQIALHSAPFRTCLSRPWSATPWIMPGHIDWRGGLPASLHPELIRRLGRWNPRALRVTDALEMRALRSVEWAAERAWRAGNDVLLVGRDWQAGLAAMAALASRLRSRGTRGLELARLERRARRRVAPQWARLARLLATEETPRESPADHLRLMELFRRAVAWSDPLERAVAAGTRGRGARSGGSRPGAAAGVPAGPWSWVIPEALPPYCDLRGWRPSRAASRSIARIEWVPSDADGAWVRELARRLAAGAGPVLWVTLIRGVPVAAKREVFRPLLELPGLRVVAHLLDEAWPPAPKDGRFSVALTGGPSAEALDALAEAVGGAE